MSFLKVNDVVAGSSWADTQRRFNRLAKDANGIKLKGNEFEGCEQYRQQINLQGVLTGNGAQIAFSNLTAIAGVVYYKITATDQSGNRQSVVLAPSDVTVAVNMNTSNLNNQDKWLIQVGVSIASPIATEGDCQNAFAYQIANPAVNQTVTKDTRDQIGTLSVAVNDTTVADGGSIALAAATVGDIVYGKLKISEIAGQIVSISNITVSGDGSFPQAFSPFLPAKVGASGSLEGIWVLMDTAAAGAKTASVVITSDDSASPYNLDITLTVA